MTQSDLIDFIVFHIDCNDCPCYVGCRRDQPRTCREYISKMFRACDLATERAVSNLVERIRRTKTQLMHTMDIETRRKIQAELADLRRQLREVKEYIND